MSIHNSLQTKLPIITPHSTVKEVVAVMDSFQVSHVPILNASHFIGMLPLEAIEIASHDEQISDFLYDLDTFFIKETAKWEEAMELFAKYDTNILPVLDGQNQYIGYYLLQDLMGFFSEMPFLKEKGSFVVLEKDQERYSFSEIAQIVESHQGRMLGILISNTYSNRVQITLKIISDSISEILQTFRRYEYAILLEKEDDLYLQELKGKTDYFEKYLNI
ncbi:CBS domain-containing protein [Capnocytophaga canis]|uniref:CBS domain-containing protein n=1 Tax=Capnocytophaga canis TaxID=1848903 RepID=UPI001F50F276|nr:CBS domain-containing protein [Capnocytophaga canis]